MIDLQHLAARHGYHADARGFDVGLARIVPIDDSDDLVVYTSDEPTAAALWVENFGETLYRSKASGYLSLRISQRQLWRVVEVMQEQRRS